MGALILLSQGFFSTLWIALNRLIAAFYSENHLHNARFAALHELMGLIGNLSQHPETSLLLGVSHFNQVLRVAPAKTRRELGNLLVVAPTRGGKGLLAVSQLPAWPHSVIVNDIKGDLFAQTAGFRSTLGKVLVIDPSGIGNRYDPLEGRHTEDELLSSSTQLLFTPHQGEGAIFTQRATVMLTQLFLGARIEGVAPFPYVRAMIRQGLSACVDRLNTISPELATQFLDSEFEKVSLSDRFLLSSWGTLSARLRPLLTETVVRSLSASDLSGGDLMTSPKPLTVYLRWPERDLLALSPLVRLLWGSLIDELITTYDRAQGRGCHPVLLLIDEAGRTAIPSLADHATTVVGRGVSLWIAVQSLAQLDAVYGRTRARVLLDNMESQIYYRPANQETADYLEHSLGKHSEYAHSHTLRAGTAASEGRSEQAIPLLTAQDIKQLGDEDTICFHRHLPPFRAKRMDWRGFSVLTQRQVMPAPTPSALPPVESYERSTLWQQVKHSNALYIDPDRLN